MFFSFFFCFVLSLCQDEKNPTLIHYWVKNLPIPQILFYTLFVCYLMWCESREFLISSRMARSNKKRKLLRIGIIKIYDDWNNFSFCFRNARMTFARCSGNGVNGKSIRCHWKKNMDPVLTFSIRPNFICLGCKVFKWFRTPDCVIWLGQKRSLLNLSTWTIMLFMFSCFCLFRRDRDRYDTSRSPSPRGKKNVKMCRVWRTVLPENTVQ